MKHFFSLLFFFILVFGLSYAQEDITTNPNQPSKSFGQLPLAESDALSVTITHSVDPVTVTAGMSVACTNAGITADNQYWRSFILADFGITEDFTVTMVEVGIEVATAGSGGQQPMTVNLYTADSPWPTVSLTLIGTADVMVPDQSLTLFQIPVTGTAPAGSELVVEISIPDATGGENHSFYLGANNLGQTADSYLSSVSCGIPGPPAGLPSTTQAIGFPDAMWVMSVTGDVAGGTSSFYDDFDSYLAGEQLACQNPTDWTTWSILPCDPTEDPYISSNYAYSSPNSVVIVQNNDLVRMIGETSGTWYISFLFYIPSGNSGYFNTLTGFTPDPYEWAFDSFFDATGAGRLDTIGAGGGGGTNVSFTWTPDQWNQVVVIVDLDAPNHPAEYWIGTNPTNFTMVATWDWTQAGSKATRIAGNDFFGGASTDEMYVDNYYFDDAMPPIIPVELTSFTAVSDNGVVQLNWQTATEINNHMFEIQRKAEASEFVTIGYVEGAGTTTEPQSYSYTDNEVQRGTYVYRLKQIDFNGTFTYSNEVEVDATGPLTFNLGQNYPNPFNPSTKINYSIPEDGNIKLAVYNIVGEEVAVLVNGFTQAGSFDVTFNASNLPSGVYIYKLQSANSIQTKKMLLLK
ncbi:MAG: T9SS type A sorting domain-containing protein [Chlorobium sp.]|nr:T9SS type A sorting domain-containing protein [Chlorobium sp.]